MKLQRRGIIATTTIGILLLSVALGAGGIAYLYNTNSNSPLVEITSLSNNEVVPAGQIELRGIAADLNGPIKAVSVRIDGGPPTLVTNSASDSSEWSVLVPLSATGNHTIEVEVTDGSGKTAMKEVSVLVVDPASAMAIPSDQIIEATKPSGAVVQYPIPAVQDKIRNLGSPDCLPASGSLFPIGTTTVTCTAAYGGDSTVSANFTVSVRDTTPPTLVAPPDIVVENTGVAMMHVSLGKPVVRDVGDSAPKISNNAPANGFELGTTTVVWTALDNNGNKATATQKVTVTAANSGNTGSSTNENTGTSSGYAGGGGGGGGGSTSKPPVSDSGGGNGVGAAKDTTAPTVGITSPASGTTLQEGSVALKGVAADESGGSGIKSVQARLDGGSFTTAVPQTTADWSTWSATFTLSAGQHTIYARATDNAGNYRDTSITLTIVKDDGIAEDTIGPSVAILQPEAGSTASIAGGTILVTGSASDSGSGVKSVEVRVDDGSYAEANPKAPGDWSTWSVTLPITAGEHRLVPRATDNAGNQAWGSIYVTFVEPGEDTTAPSVAITSPVGGSTLTLAGSTIALQGSASDSGSGIRIVEVRIDDGSYVPATPKAPGDWSTWSVTLPITAGEHRLVPRAIDNAGNQAWNSIYVTLTQSSGGGSTSTLDNFGIKKIYQTKQGANEWYVNMNDPASDPLFRNLPAMTKQPDGSWQVNGGSRGQVRMEAWSPSGEKWHNVEITGYAKIISGSNELIQWYSRGGHHTSSNECLGSAVKARLYGNGEARWVKEITHPAYTANRASVQATDDPLKDRWIGFKAVIYNFVVNGKTFVKMESYIDDRVTDSRGNLVIGNNWKLASVTEDRGGWSTSSSSFNSSCQPLNKDSTSQYRQRDEIINMPGGTSSQNIAAWRSDDLTWNWKYLSVREIVPPS